MRDPCLSKPGRLVHRALKLGQFVEQRLGLFQRKYLNGHGVRQPASARSPRCVYHIHTIRRCAKALFVSDDIFCGIVSRCFERTGIAARAQSIFIQLEGMSADPGAKGGDHLQVIRITGIPMARPDPTSRAVAGSQPLGKRG